MQREIPFHDGCFPKAPNIYDIFNHVKVAHAENVWWECDLPHLDLMQARDTLHWHHMWDFGPPPQAHISVCIYVFLLPYLYDIVVLFMGFYGGRTGSLYVPHGMEPLPITHATWFIWSIAPTMLICFESFTPGHMDYAHLMLTLEEQFMMYWLDEHLAYDEDLIIDGVINGGGEVLQLSHYQ